MRPFYAYRRLWPLFLLLVAELAALIYFARLPSGGPPVLATRFSALVALLILGSGLLPAVLRPGPETLLAGCLATVLASILVTPFGTSALPPHQPGQLLIVQLPPYISLRLLNGILLGPLALHLTARFPLRHAISNRRLDFVYITSLGVWGVGMLVSGYLTHLTGLLLMVSWTFALLVAAAHLLLRTSRQTDPQYLHAARQARLLFFGLAAAEVPALLRPLGLMLGVEIIPYNLFLTAQILVPFSIAYAVLRHDLFGIDRALRRALAYGLLSILLLALYFALTVSLTALAANIWPQFRSLAAFASLLAAALAFSPVQQRIQFWIDRALYPDRLAFRQEITRAQGALQDVVNRQDIVHLLTQDMPPRLGAEWGSLSLAPAPDVPAQTGSTPAWNAQLIVGGRALGRYWLGPRRAGPSYSPEEQSQLQALARQASLALAYAETIESLRQFNRELEMRVAERTAQVLDQQRALAAHEERQRLARDLHDSVTQALFSINLSARALRKLLERDPQAVASGLGELESAAQQALGEMRTLLAQLRSPLGEPQVEDNAETGLCALLRQHCTQLAREPGLDGLSPLLAVHLELPDEVPLPLDITQSLFQIAREALHNVIKHSGTRQAACQVQRQGNWLELVVADQGQGFVLDQAADSSFGLRGISERIASLGGELQINSQPGLGVRLTVRIPLDKYSHPPSNRTPGTQ